MSASLIAALLWLLAANVLAILPSRRNHWPQAWALIAAGVPLLGWLTWQNGPWLGLLALAAGASILRWPLRYGVAWLRRRLGGAGR